MEHGFSFLCTQCIPSSLEVCVPHVLKFYSKAPGCASVFICHVQWFLSITVHVPQFWQMFLQSLWGFPPLYFSYSLFLELLLYGYGASLTSLLIFLPFLLFCTPLAIFELHFLGDFLIVTFQSFWVFHFCCHIFNLKEFLSAVEALLKNDNLFLWHGYL